MEVAVMMLNSKLYSQNKFYNFAMYLTLLTQLF
jgi:hypothetical protein